MEPGVCQHRDAQDGTIKSPVSAWIRSVQYQPYFEHVGRQIMH